jgi:YD repeat-containing protein
MSSTHVKRRMSWTEFGRLMVHSMADGHRRTQR